jgi:hypothetical protein
MLRAPALRHQDIGDRLNRGRVASVRAFGAGAGIDEFTFFVVLARISGMLQAAMGFAFSRRAGENRLNNFSADDSYQRRGTAAGLDLCGMHCGYLSGAG